MNERSHSSSLQRGAAPWYREPWPWLLMAGPLLVIVAGGVTTWLAVSTSDGLVTENYYRQGLAMHRTLLRDERARVLGLAAGVRIADGRLAVRLRAGDHGFAPPAKLLATLSHPTRAGLDQAVELSRRGDTYFGEVHLPAAGHWLLLLEDEAHTWRLLGNLVLPANHEIMLGETKPE